MKKWNKGLAIASIMAVLSVPFAGAVAAEAIQGHVVSSHPVEEGSTLPEEHVTSQGIIESGNGSKFVLRGQQYLHINVQDNTVIVNEKGQTLSKEALKEGAVVEVQYGPIMLMTFPGTVGAEKIVVKGETVVKEGKVLTVTKTDGDVNGRVHVDVDNDGNINNDVVLNISKETYIMDKQGVALKLADLKEGQKVKAFHSLAMTFSLPGQSHASLIIVE